MSKALVSHANSILIVFCIEWETYLFLITVDFLKKNITLKEVHRTLSQYSGGHKEFNHNLKAHAYN